MSQTTTSITTATIDGKTVDVQSGETILHAARRVGVDIPTLCYQDGLPAEGGCRICLVELSSGGRVEAACHTPLRPGMEIVTESGRIQALRRDVLSLTISDNPANIFEAGAEHGEFGGLMERLGVESSEHGTLPCAAERDTTHPYLRFDPATCVTCRRCLIACETVQGQFVYGIEGRGGSTRLVFGADEAFSESACTACGACVDACPTGAISDRDRNHKTLPMETTTQSVCGYCGVGCRIEIGVRDGVVERIDPVEDAAVNRGHLCVKGRYAHAYHRSGDRLTTPLLRDGDGFRPIGWDEALSWVAERMNAIRAAHGPDALGVITCSRSTNEAGYLFQKLFRAVVGTNNVDCCARVCHSSTALALQLATGTGAASASYDDIERARCIVICGANATEAHPVVGARLKQARLHGATVIVVDPRRIELAEFADLHLALRPGTNVALFNAISKCLIDDGVWDQAYVDERTEGFAELQASLADLDLDEMASACNVAVSDIRAAAQIIGAGPALFVSGLGLSETTQGTASVLTMANLAMLTGSFGRPGAGALPLRGQNSVQGNADMGGMPNLVTGYQPLDDETTQARCREVWGVAAPPKPGWTIPEMFDAAVRGDLKALWIQGEDVVQSDPNEAHVLKAMEAIDLLVVQDLFLSETAKYADLVLPAAGALEQDGTFTNGERRIQRVRAAVDPPGDARADWEIACDLATALGQPWSYESPAEIMDEIATIAPHLFGGVQYDRLDGDGLQWPCPDPSHPGTANVHTDGFIRGRGRFTVAPYVQGPEDNVAGFPYLLITGRVLDHYNVGTMTRRTPSVDLVAHDVMEMHPSDARELGLNDGERARVESQWGVVEIPVDVTSRVPLGTLFLTFHFPETHANRLVGPSRDCQSNCPGYKVTSVKVAAAT